MYAPIVFRTETAKTSKASRAFASLPFGALCQRFDVTLAGRQREKAALMIEQIFKTVGVELLCPEKIYDDAGVEVAGPSPHGNTAGWSQAHRGVDGFSISQGTKARAVPQVREDGSLGKLRSEMMYQRFVRDAVKAVTANPRFEVALRQCEVRGDFGNRLMESVVETGELRGRRKDRLCGSDQR